MSRQRGESKQVRRGSLNNQGGLHTDCGLDWIGLERLMIELFDEGDVMKFEIG